MRSMNMTMQDERNEQEQFEYIDDVQDEYQDKFDEYFKGWDGTWWSGYLYIFEYFLGRELGGVQAIHIFSNIFEYF